MEHKDVWYALVALFCLLAAGCVPGGLDEAALATEVASTIQAERTAQAAATSPATPAEVALSPTTAARATPVPVTEVVVVRKASPTSSRTATPTKTPTVTPTPTPAGPPLAKEQVLRLAALSLEDVDPAQASISDERQVAFALFAGLTRQDEESAEVLPAMARSWTVSEDGLLWTFSLRDDVPWVQVVAGKVEPVSDGGRVRMVTAHDFEYGFKRLLDPDVSVVSSYLSMIDGAEAFSRGEAPASAVGVRALDDLTLEVHLAAPRSDFDAIAGMPVAVAMPRWLIEAEGEGWTDARSMQSYGPFVLSEWEPGSDVVLVRNPHWPGAEGVPQATLDTISWRVMDQEAMLVAFQAGELDTVELWGSALTAATGDSNLSLQPRVCTSFVAFNTAKPPLDDPRVRRAFSMAFDREAVVGDVLMGTQDPARWFSHPGLRGAPAADEGGAAFDPDQARALLDEAYPDRAQFPAVEFGFFDYAPHTEIAGAAERGWSAVLGVPIDLQPMTGTSLLDALEKDPPQIWRLSLCMYSYADVAAQLGDLLRDDGALRGWTQWSSDEVDDLLREADGTLDLDARAALYARIEQILVEKEAVVIPLSWHTGGIMTQPQLERTFAVMPGLEHLEKWRVLAASAPMTTPQPTRTPRPTSTRPPAPTRSPTRSPTSTPKATQAARPTATRSAEGCSAKSALVQVINQLSVGLTVELSGMGFGSFSVSANSSKSICLSPGIYNYTARAIGYNPLKGSKTFTSGACECWQFYVGVKSPVCNCSSDRAKYSPLR